MQEQDKSGFDKFNLIYFVRNLKELEKTKMPMVVVTKEELARLEKWKKFGNRTEGEEALGSKLFQEKEFMDLKIICKGKVFECHKNVLSCQSDVFKTMLLNMKTDEAKSGEVKIKDIDGKFCLNFIYNFTTSSQ